MTDDVVIGKLGRPHGVHGEVRLYAYNPDSALLAPGLRVRTDDDRELVVTAIRSADKYLIVTIDGVSSREDAEPLTNREIAVSRGDLQPLDEDEFYLVDVVGLEVWAAQTGDDEPRELGVVKGWLDVGPVDIMAVTGPRIAGRLLVPYLDHIVRDIDFDAGRVNLFPLNEWTPEDD